MKPAITAGNLQAPPPWALLQRELFDFMAEAVRYAAGRYGRPDGTPLNAQDADDAYEAHSYRGLFYALRASDETSASLPSASGRGSPGCTTLRATRPTWSG